MSFIEEFETPLGGEWPELKRNEAVQQHAGERWCGGVFKNPSTKIKKNYVANER